jgi:predicted nuclease of restriction endonuclease-like RecB superfamily
LRKISQITRNKIGKANAGKRNGMFGKPPLKTTYGIWSKYKNIWMRSNWERFFAKWCDINHINWTYEPKRFDLGNLTYAPDFYLPDLKLFIEIKGYWKPIAKKKYNLFKRLYPKLHIIYLMRDELKLLGVFNET